MQIILDLPEHLYHQIENFARLTNQDIPTLLTNTLQYSIPALSLVTADPLSTLSDQKILALTQLQLHPEQDLRLSELLDRQQAGLLSSQEEPELQNLLKLYQDGLVRKATALQEAVQRGLIPPLSNHEPISRQNTSTGFIMALTSLDSPPQAEQQLLP